MKCMPLFHSYKYTGNKDGLGRMGDGPNVMFRYKCTKCGKMKWKSK
ncbi:hypothetical protein GCM10007971_13110 [Oceanobacillus indicireducens]|uniref:Uncharacterized protein n=1 Tax=Oceanobacillus indicireducens TaxID=1004261 RepID=A0A918D0J5_9BACI|nr:hypothetical protein GCM10007971_13110 [Oceanobacillus indicireducens]